jgi:carboxylesterase
MTKNVQKLLRVARGVLFTDPKLLYKEELALTNKPFYFEGTSNKAVLLIHGWTSVPYEVRRLGKYLNENGYTTYGPMLSGHGTVPKNLENICWNDWLDDVTEAYQKLKKNHDKVYVAGTSIGASLAVLLARKNPEISGLVLMAMPYNIRMERTMKLLAKFNLMFKKYNKKFYPPTFGASTTITRLIAYQSYPISSAIETFSLVKRVRQTISEIKQPCFILQSTSDHVVGRKSLEKIYANIGSEIKKKKYIKRAYHTFISDIRNESVFEDILNFIEEN